jgi:hypothetical protein
MTEVVRSASLQCCFQLGLAVSQQVMKQAGWQVSDAQLVQQLERGPVPSQGQLPGSKL